MGARLGVKPGIGRDWGAAAEADAVREQQLRWTRSGSPSTAEEGAIGVQQLHEAHTIRPMSSRAEQLHWAQHRRTKEK